MRRWSIAGLALSAALALVPPVGADDARGGAYVDPLILRRGGVQTVLVHVRDVGQLDAGLESASTLGLTIGSTYPEIGVFVAYGPRETFLALAELPAIEQLEANRRLRYFTNTSHRATRGELLLSGAIRYRGELIDGTGVGVAVVDSGVDGTHPDLSSRMGRNVRIYCTAPGTAIAIGVQGFGFSECRGQKVIVPMQDTDTPGAGGHGTHVAGIVAGTGAA